MSYYNNPDPYNNGIPKYSTVDDISEALDKMSEMTEAEILSDIGYEVSWEGETYIYTDRAYTLKEKLNEMTSYGRKTWILELAIARIDKWDIHDIAYMALYNTEVAKRLGFKPLFVDVILLGNKKYYDKITEEWYDRLSDLDKFDASNMHDALNQAMEEIGAFYNTPCYENTYRHFANKLQIKVENLRLEKEEALIYECRAHLTSYDDFIYALKSAQVILEQTTDMYEAKFAKLKNSYEERFARLLGIAEEKGLLEDFTEAIKAIETSKE